MFEIENEYSSRENRGVSLTASDEVDTSVVQFD